MATTTTTTTTSMYHPHASNRCLSPPVFPTRSGLHTFIESIICDIVLNPTHLQVVLKQYTIYATEVTTSTDVRERLRKIIIQLMSPPVFQILYKTGQVKLNLYEGDEICIPIHQFAPDSTLSQRLVALVNLFKTIPYDWHRGIDLPHTVDKTGCDLLQAFRAMSETRMGSIYYTDVSQSGGGAQQRVTTEWEMTPHYRPFLRTLIRPARMVMALIEMLQQQYDRTLVPLDSKNQLDRCTANVLLRELMYEICSAPLVYTITSAMRASGTPFSSNGNIIQLVYANSTRYHPEMDTLRSYIHRMPPLYRQTVETLITALTECEVSSFYKTTAFAHLLMSREDWPSDTPLWDTVWTATERAQQSSYADAMQYRIMIRALTVLDVSNRFLDRSELPHSILYLIACLQRYAKACITLRFTLPMEASAHHLAFLPFALPRVWLTTGEVQIDAANHSMLQSFYQHRHSARAHLLLYIGALSTAMQLSSHNPREADGPGIVSSPYSMVFPLDDLIELFFLLLCTISEGTGNQALISMTNWDAIRASLYTRTPRGTEHLKVYDELFPETRAALLNALQAVRCVYTHSALPRWFSSYDQPQTGVFDSYMPSTTTTTAVPKTSSESVPSTPVWFTCTELSFNALRTVLTQSIEYYALFHAYEMAFTQQHRVPVTCVLVDANAESVCTVDDVYYALRACETFWGIDLALNSYRWLIWQRRSDQRVLIVADTRLFRLFQRCMMLHHMMHAMQTNESIPLLTAQSQQQQQQHPVVPNVAGVSSILAAALMNEDQAEFRPVALSFLKFVWTGHPLARDQHANSKHSDETILKWMNVLVEQFSTPEEMITLYRTDPAQVKKRLMHCFYYSDTDVDAVAQEPEPESAPVWRYSKLVNMRSRKFQRVPVECEVPASVVEPYRNGQMAQWMQDAHHRNAVHLTALLCVLTELHMQCSWNDRCPDSATLMQYAQMVCEIVSGTRIRPAFLFKESDRVCRGWTSVLPAFRRVESEMDPTPELFLPTPMFSRLERNIQSHVLPLIQSQFVHL